MTIHTPPPEGGLLVRRREARPVPRVTTGTREASRRPASKRKRSAWSVSDGRGSRGRRLWSVSRMVGARRTRARDSGHREVILLRAQPRRARRGRGAGRRTQLTTGVRRRPACGGRARHRAPRIAAGHGSREARPATESGERRSLPCLVRVRAPLASHARSCRAPYLDRKSVV